MADYDAALREYGGAISYLHQETGRMNKTEYEEIRQFAVRWGFRRS